MMFIISEWGYPGHYIPGKIEPPTIFANRLRELTADSPIEGVADSRIGLEWTGSSWRLPIHPNSLSYFSYGMVCRNNIGSCFGVSDEAMAEQNFMISAVLGCPESMYMYASYLENNHIELSRNWYRRAAIAGLRVACKKMSQILEADGDLEGSGLWISRAYRIPNSSLIVPF
jgi:hypothetical protein